MKNKKKQVRITEELHAALQHMQRQFKKKKGIEPTMGDLIEKAFDEDPVLREVVAPSNDEEGKFEEQFMKL